MKSSVRTWSGSSHPIAEAPVTATAAPAPAAQSWTKRRRRRERRRGGRDCARMSGAGIAAPTVPQAPGDPVRVGGRRRTAQAGGLGRPGPVGGHPASPISGTNATGPRDSRAYSSGPRRVTRTSS
jgi:hypothetical protein